METQAFLEKILPTRGHYFVATLNQGEKRPWFKHFPCESVAEAAFRARELDSGGYSVYHACSSFRAPEIVVERDGKQVRRERVQDNVAYVRSFWMDLDVGAGENKYPTQRDAVIGIADFLQVSGLPIPMLVSSGYGVHVYWPLQDDILPTQWLTTARMLKDLGVGIGLKADPTRTADSASVLRPVGTHNRKAGAVRGVELIRDGAATDYQAFHDAVVAACRDRKITVSSEQRPPKADNPNQAFLVQQDFPKSFATPIAERCPQIRSVRDSGGRVSEPVWFHAIQVLIHTEERDAVIHSWSSGYPGYTVDETDKKIARLREEKVGPTTCAQFYAVNPGGCTGCPFRSKITSPIQLGITVKPLDAPRVVVNDGVQEIAVEVPNPPKPFIRSADGVYVEIDAGVPVKIFNYDFYLSETVKDAFLTSHSATAHYKLPHDEPVTFSLPFGVTSSPAELDRYLREQGMLPENPKYMVKYVTSYLQTLQAKTKTRRLVQQMGWTDNYDAFVLGKKIFHSDGRITETTLSQKFGESAAGFRFKGEIESWVAPTARLGEPGMEAHAFSLLLGFGAPLLKFTGHHGVIFSLLGRSGGGKSTMLAWLLSIWGDHNRLAIGQDGTELAKLERIGALNNIPITIDEASNWPGDAVSKLAYQITRGEGRLRLRQDATERPTTSWNTFLVVSTNQALQAKLEANKGDSVAEMVRVFEYEVPNRDGMHTYWRDLWTVLENTHGVVGERYVRNLVQNSASIKADLRRIEDHIMSEGACTGEERFWVAGIACAVYGGLVARRLGLIRFEIPPILQWVVGQIKRSRANLVDSHADEISLLGAYLDEFAGNRIVVAKDQADPDKLVDPTERLRAPQLYQRLELHTGYLYVARNHLKKELTKRHIDYDRFKKNLVMRGVLVNPDARKCLGAGTGYVSVQVPCWKINLKHASLVGVLEEAKNGRL